MKNIFVFKLSAFDTFTVRNAINVNLNDFSQLYYTFWHPMGSKKHIYCTQKPFMEEAMDLLYISLMIFYADRKIRRDAQYDAWTREFELYIPVKVIDKWERCKELLTKALKFLTGDHWTLHFRSRVALTDDENNYKKNRHRYRHSIKHVDANEFCMLSGGLDSFIGAINLLTEGKKPIFVGNYNGGKGVKKYQDDVVASLMDRYGVRADLFFRFFASPVSGEESSTRSRSLLFFSHAIAIASGMEHHVDLYIPENGVISINIPLTIMRLGSLSTRTTHPYFMGMLQQLIQALGIDITLVNPFQFKTKGEMMLECKDRDFLYANYQKTMSCSHPDQGRWSGEHTGHCGECLPCTIRKAAIKAADLADATYYRHHYETPSGKLALKSYRQGLSSPKDPVTAIQMSGPITDHCLEFSNLYERGIKELKDYIDTL